MSEPESRPRPQYGEYASASEQRAHIREPLPEATPLVPPTAPVTAPIDPSYADWHAITAEQGAAEAARAARKPDRMITITLLAIGALNVVTSFFSFLNFAETIDRSYVMMGVDGSFSNFEAGKLWGLISALVLVAGYILTVVISRARMKTNKAAWFTPLVGAVVTYAIIMACISVPLMSDPAFMEYVTSRSS